MTLMNRAVSLWPRVFLAVVLACTATVALAWEVDVHYGLTKWLALKAGFAEGDAEQLARGAQVHDTGTLGPVLLGAAACAGDLNSALTIRDRHFPSFELPPAAPMQRSVSKNADKAARELDLTIAGAANSLFDVGRTMHPYQDSWSHQGVPDTPPLCRADYSYSHPQDRGGWMLHDADLTHLHPGDTVEMARGTYRFLSELRIRRGGATMRAPQWDANLSNAVADFAARQTIGEKAAWFKAQGFKEPLSFLQEISLPLLDAGAEAARRDLTGKRLATGSPLVIGRGKNELEREAIDRFLTEWIRQARAPKKDWLVRHADMPALQKTLGVRHGIDSASDMQALFDMWLVQDHGLVVQAGHGAPGTMQKLRLLVEGAARIEYKEIAEALEAIGESQAPYVMLTGRKLIAERYGDSAQTIYFRFRNTPRDLLVLVFAGAKPRLVDFVWIVEE